MDIIVDIDILSYAGDDELEYRMSSLAADRDRALQADMDPRPWEEEMAERTMSRSRGLSIDQFRGPPEFWWARLARRIRRRKINPHKTLGALQFNLLV